MRPRHAPTCSTDLEPVRLIGRDSRHRRLTVRRVRDVRAVDEPGTTRFGPQRRRVPDAATLLAEFSARATTRPRAAAHLAVLLAASRFLTIGIIWMNHHHTVSLIARTTGRCFFINNLLLLTVASCVPTKLSATTSAAATSRRRLAMQRPSSRWRSAGLVAVRPPQPALIADDARLGAARGRPRLLARCADVRGRLRGGVLQPARRRPITFAIAAFYLPSAALFDRDSARRTLRRGPRRRSTGTISTVEPSAPKLG